MKITERKISELKPAEYNPRELSDKQYKDIKNSLETFGIVDAVIINSNPDRKDIIIGGHQRCKVWADLGNETIPTYAVNLPFEKEKELNVRLNKNTGEFDKDILANLFDVDELIEWGFEAWELGITDEEISDNNSDLDEGETFVLELVFDDAAEQLDAYNKLIEDGYNVKIKNT